MDPYAIQQLHNMSLHLTARQALGSPTTLSQYIFITVQRYQELYLWPVQSKWVWPQVDLGAAFGLRPDPSDLQDGVFTPFDDEVLRNNDLYDLDPTQICLPPSRGLLLPQGEASSTPFLAAALGWSRLGGILTSPPRQGIFT